MSKPRLSVHMMVRNASDVVERALRPLKGLDCEVCFVDTGSVDGTPDVLRRLCGELGISWSGMEFSPTSRPDLYFKDEPREYASHAVLPGCQGAYLLRDWSAARNMGLGLCRGDYVLKLDADDEVMDPINLPKALDELDTRPEVDILCCPYEVMDGQEVAGIQMYSRIWRNHRHIRFRELCHENIDWCRRSDGSNWLMVGYGLTVRDWRDCHGADTRTEHRNLKVLLRGYVDLLRSGIEPCGHLRIYLADEAATVRPLLALEALDGLPADLHRMDQAWARLIRGRCYETMGFHTDARVEYAKAETLGFCRAELLSALMMTRLAPARWAKTLAQAVANNEGQYYPTHASHAELREARKLLETTGTQLENDDAS